jgi:hypothetical protein
MTGIVAHCHIPRAAKVLLRRHHMNHSYREGVEIQLRVVAVSKVPSRNN